MGALLPTLQAEHLREGLTDYLATTFALTDPDAQSALTDFVGDPDTGMFKGPYVRLRLPFAPAGDDWAEHLDWWPQDFTPYGHQARAFAQLSTKQGDRPQPTLVTTGTGSGKTEAFLYPILDHVLRARKSGVTGMKALILYPMNALANDQAERLAKLIAGDPALAGVTAGLYTGEQSSGGRTRVTADGLITDRALMHDAPPDILLTNYKMLDQLLLHPGRADMWRLSAESLQYLVLDEFHTYDGAQGTDVAMLLRRLGLTLKSHWTDDVAGDRRGPCPSARPDHPGRDVGDARLAGGADGHARLRAHRVRRGVRRRRGDRGDPAHPRRVAQRAARQPRRRVAARRTGAARRARPDRRRDRCRPGQPGHRRRGVRRTVREAHAVKRFREPTSTLRRCSTSSSGTASSRRCWRAPSTPCRSPTWPTGCSRPWPSTATPPAPTPHGSASWSSSSRCSRTCVPRRAARRSASTSTCGSANSAASTGRCAPPPSTAGPTTAALADDQELYLPAVYCRHCGRSGWGARLAPTGTALDVTDEAIRADHAAGASRFRALISAPAEAQVPGGVDGLRWFHLDHRELLDTTPDPESADVVDGRLLPVLTLVGPDADEQSKEDVCPACGATDGIRFLGSAVATQLSVTLSNLFGDETLDAAEKKALMFTDSVQDAAHRAGFVQARSHSLTLRTALRSALGDGELDLDELARPSSPAPVTTRCCATSCCRPTSSTATSSSRSGRPTPTPTRAAPRRTRPSGDCGSTSTSSSGCSPAPAAPWNSPAASPPRSTWARRRRRRSSADARSSAPTPRSSR